VDEPEVNRRVLLFAIVVVLVVRLVSALPAVDTRAHAQSGTIPTPTRPGGKPPQPTREGTEPPPGSTQVPAATATIAPTALPGTPATTAPTMANTPVAIDTATPQPSAPMTVSPGSATGSAGSTEPIPSVPAGTTAPTMTATAPEMGGVPATAELLTPGAEVGATVPIPSAGAEGASPTAVLQALPTWTVAARPASLADAGAGSSTTLCLWGMASLLLVVAGAILLLRHRRDR
jgi:hypothetical protein